MKNYEAILWMHNHKYLYDSAFELALDCAANLNLWERKYQTGYIQSIPDEVFKMAKNIIR